MIVIGIEETADRAEDATDRTAGDREAAAISYRGGIRKLTAELSMTILNIVNTADRCVQGRNSLETGLAIIPYSLSIFVAAVLVARLPDRLSSRLIARSAFVMVAAALASLGLVVRNDWETFMVSFGLIVLGLGQGALVMTVFNVLAGGFARGVGRRCGPAAGHHQQPRRGRRHRA